MSNPDFTLLNQIQFPADLRKLRIDQLPQVCDELRQDIIEKVSKNPGHFASSLGVVELTVALHYVFDTPNDRIVWDVGHHAFEHVLLMAQCTLQRVVKADEPFAPAVVEITFTAQPTAGFEAQTVVGFGGV